MNESYFYHHPNGTIEINGYIFSEELFSLIEPMYSLPKGAIGRRYIPQKKHIVVYKGFQKGQPKKWIDGDRFICRIPELNYLIDNFEEYDLIHMRQVLKQQVGKRMELIDGD
tara:strand:- start:874 stop:1209 length:336 start_codon:yes stop_codon:yes gene_type:complete